jgi:predicted P-loop ATPase
MVKRIRRPGCKHDESVLFISMQGISKTTLVETLAPQPDWFTDEILLGDASKEMVLSLAGKCIVEIAEMGMRGSANTNHVKAMLSRRVDRGRTAYARTVSDRPRRNVFAITVNEGTPLTDPTGNRRFLPVRLERAVDIEGLKALRDQILGEAAARETTGETFRVPESLWAKAGEHQEAAREKSDMELQLQDWFAETPTTMLAYITAGDLTEVATLARWSRNNNVRSETLKKLGFREVIPEINGKRTRVWVRGPASLRPVDIQNTCVRYMVGSNGNGLPRVAALLPGTPQIPGSR